MDGDGTLEKAPVPRDDLEGAAVVERHAEDPGVRPVEQAETIDRRGDGELRVGRTVHEGGVAQVARHEVHRRRGVA